MDKLKHNYKYNIVGGLLGAFVASSAGFLVTYLKEVGGNDIHFALLNALPSMIAVFVLIPGAIIIDNTKNKLRTTLIICFLSRAFFLLYAFVPFLPKALQPITLVALMGLRNAPEAVWGVGYQSLVADVFPMNKLNAIIGDRNKFNSVLTIGATFIVGIFLSLNEKYPIDILFLYEVLFVFTFLIGAYEVLQYKKFVFDAKPPQKSGNISKKLFYIIKTLPEHPKYIKYCITVIIFYLGWQMSWPLYNLYQLDVLHANAAWVGYLNITSTIVQFLTIGLWIKLTDKLGNITVLGICMSLMALSPFAYAISDTLPMLLVMQLVVGSGMSGATTLLFNELIYVSPEKDRTLYISLFTCFTQITSSFMPFIGTFLKGALSIHAALYISGIIRIIGAVIFLWAFKSERQNQNKENNI